MKTRNAPPGSSEEGFTWIELTAILAVMGFLYLALTPNIETYHERSRQAEARVFLAAAFTAEKGFFAEQNTYTSCLHEIGFTPDGFATNTGKRYYAVGFRTGSNSDCGPNGGFPCNSSAYANNTPLGSPCALGNGHSGYDAVSYAHREGRAAGVVDLSSSRISRSTFLLEAVGNVSKESSAFDRWTIDDLKTITNTDSHP
jgi:Tfp pilus assembly protein PilE